MSTDPYCSFLKNCPEFILFAFFNSMVKKTAANSVFGLGSSENKPNIVQILCIEKLTKRNWLT